MTHVLEDHEGAVSIGGRTVTNLRFADDIDGLAGEGKKLAKLVESLHKASITYGMDILCREDQVDDKKHQWHQHKDQSKWTEAETVTSFKYLGSHPPSCMVLSHGPLKQSSKEEYKPWK